MSRSKKNKVRHSLSSETRAFKQEDMLKAASGAESVSREQIKAVLDKLKPLKKDEEESVFFVNDLEEDLPDTALLDLNNLKKDNGIKKEKSSTKNEDLEVKAADSALLDIPSEEEKSETKKSEKQPKHFKKKENIPKEKAVKKEAAKESSPKKKGSGKAFLIAGIVGAVACCSYLFVGYGYFSNRFFPGTFINEYDASGKTIEDVAALMKADTDNYKFTITKKGEVIDTFKGSDVGLSDEKLEENLSQICTAQHKYAWLRYFVKPKESHVKSVAVYDYDDTKFNNTVENLNAVSLPTTIENQNAKVVFDGDRYVITPEVQGDTIDKAALTDLIMSDVKSLTPSLEIEGSNVYVEPEIKRDNDALIASTQKVNAYLDRPIVIKTLGATYQPGNATLNSWIDVDTQGNITANHEKIGAYADTVYKKYTTYPSKTSRKFYTSHGDYVTVSGGDYGRVVDRDALVKVIEDVVYATDDDLIVIPFSVNTAMGTPENDLGNSYVEVDLTNQHMWMYKNGKLVVQSDVVTGSPGARATPQGTYKMKGVYANVTLVGDNYRTPVARWMPFNGGIGLHDATWQSAFGGNRYRNGYGSHGCVNLPLSIAKQVYNYAVAGMPVICYYH